MAFFQRSKDLLEALSDGVVAPPMVRDTLEEYLNRVGDSVGDETLAEEFLFVLGRHVDNKVRGQAKARQQVEDRGRADQAADNAGSKIPPMPGRP